MRNSPECPVVVPSVTRTLYVSAGAKEEPSKDHENDPETGASPEANEVTSSSGPVPSHSCRETNPTGASKGYRVHTTTGEGSLLLLK